MGRVCAAGRPTRAVPDPSEAPNVPDDRYRRRRELPSTIRKRATPTMGLSSAPALGRKLSPALLDVLFRRDTAGRCSRPSCSAPIDRVDGAGQRAVPGRVRALRRRHGAPVHHGNLPPRQRPAVRDDRLFGGRAHGDALQPDQARERLRLRRRSPAPAPWPAKAAPTTSSGATSGRTARSSGCRSRRHHAAGPSRHGQVRDVGHRPTSPSARAPSGRWNDPSRSFAGKVAQVAGWSFDLAGQRFEYSDELCALQGLAPGSAVSLRSHGRRSRKP
jgi:hypothetical protein